MRALRHWSNECRSRNRFALRAFVTAGFWDFLDVGPWSDACKAVLKDAYAIGKTLSVYASHARDSRDAVTYCRTPWDSEFNLERGVARDLLAAIEKEDASDVGGLAEKIGRRAFAVHRPKSELAEAVEEAKARWHFYGDAGPTDVLLTLG